MKQSTQKKRWGVERRLEFIEFVSYWEGTINRSHIMEHFGVSAPQASSDLTTYQKLAPQNLRYDLSSKRYVATDQFEFKLIEPDADRYLKQLTALSTQSVELEDTWLNTTPAAEVIPIPTRKVEPTILFGILKAIRSKRSIEIEYQSLNPTTTETAWRRVTPHAFASDGFRWHMRAYCHRDNRFKDFLLSRCSNTRAEGAPGPGVESDDKWLTYFEVKLAPNPRLSTSQKRAIEQDYAMQDGYVVLPVRYALLYYFDKRLRYDLLPQRSTNSLGDPREIPIVVANQTEYEAALETIGVQFRTDYTNKLVDNQ
ncbi:WYL domain-containing protein [Methylomonas sp. ZR1]|uniref:WYL domain-containing protein n=1 Tax=unclassified Methylomonas TaxID=2608980 RepID=UPI001492A64B|nr:WYL domain-containing protein [Methylomonas sp. ZR1]NOV28301.1 WYL domain-containing protein [Methylomonas sp. ZR1]